MFKKFFKYGLGILLPFLLVVQVFVWLSNSFISMTVNILPEGLEYRWWFTFIIIFAIIGFILLIGMLFSLIKPLRWMKDKLEKWVIHRIPGVNKIYEFGKEISDSFITDIKEDGDFAVVAVRMLGGESLGVLVDPKHNTCFVPTAPNPSNGFLIRTSAYTFVATMKYMEALKFVTSVGRLNADKWPLIGGKK